MVTLAPPYPVPERILGYGNEGAGKTYAYFCAARKSSGKLYVVDTDGTVGRFLASENWTDMRDRVEYEWVHLSDGSGYERLAQVSRDYAERAEPGDWVVVDRVDPLWDECQAYFSTAVFGKELQEHMLTFRTAAQESGKKGNAFDGLTDWPTIKKLHARLIVPLFGTKGHLFLVAGEKPIIEGVEKDGNILRAYGRIGARPAGEKNTGFMVHTVLRFSGSNEATWRVTTVKDREREQLNNTRIKDFATDYLLKVAGWRPQV